MATAEFSKFAGILSAALSQHHLSRFERAQLDGSHLVCLPWRGILGPVHTPILECEVKWALESITTNKASGGDRIPVDLFQILKDDAVKVLHSIC